MLTLRYPTAESVCFNYVGGSYFDMLSNNSFAIAADYCPSGTRDPFERIL